MSVTLHAPAFSNGRVKADPEDKLCATAEAFVREFTHFEWKYLCSYRWFLKSLARALETRDFSSLRIKARRVLECDRIRRPVRTTQAKDELSVCHSAQWYD